MMDISLHKSDGNLAPVLCLNNNPRHFKVRTIPWLDYQFQHASKNTQTDRDGSYLPKLAYDNVWSDIVKQSNGPWFHFCRVEASKNNSLQLTTVVTNTSNCTPHQLSNPANPWKLWLPPPARGAGRTSLCLSTICWFTLEDVDPDFLVNIRYGDHLLKAV